MKQLADFLKQSNISPKDFEATGLRWENLLKIEEDYQTFKEALSAPAHYLSESLNQIKDIHSLRFRIKTPNRLIEKIVRKKIKAPDSVIDIHSYKTAITDLIGLRILHLFKEDWLAIHSFITENFDLKETPIAYYRSGDSAEHVKTFKTHGCKVKAHPFGYRSVHYLVETKVDEILYCAEIQVRTVFEEGWSEIDHKIRYLISEQNTLLNQPLLRLNRLSGDADEVGSYIRYLKEKLETNAR